MKNRYFHGAITCGFTLIELIVVIAIIGTLLAFGLPKMIAIQRDARVAKVQTVYSLVRSATFMAHSRCMLDLASRRKDKNALNCASSPPIVNMEGSLVRMVNRYPAASAEGIDSAAAFSSVADGLIIGDGSSSGTPTRTFDVVGGTVPECRVIYREAVISGSIVVAPMVSLVTSGC